MQPLETLLPRLAAALGCAAFLLAITNQAQAHPEGSWDEVHAEGSWDERHAEPLVGTWKVQVTTYNCGTGVANPPFASLLTFAEHGTLSGTTANPVFLPGQRSSEHGLWRRLGENNFISTTEAFIEFGSDARGPIPPFVRGSQRIEQAIELTGRDTFTSTATLTFYDEGDTVLSAGCARASARRLSF